MARQVIQYRCLLISPSDVHEERNAVTEVVGKWNAQIGNGLDVRVELVRWESHSTPDLSAPPQQIINRQIVDDCDLGVAVFWSRLGTPTEQYPSGSIEEIYRLLQKGARVLVYFCDRPVPQDRLGDDHFEKLQNVKRQFQDQGLLATYTEISQLQTEVQLHLTNTISQMLAKDRGIHPFVPTSGSITAPTPDVRIKVQPALAGIQGVGLVSVLTITVQNHSPVTVYLGNVFLELRNGNVYLPLGDPFTGEYQKRRELHPGDSYTLNVDPAQLLTKKLPPKDIACAAVRDAIDRIYRSEKAEFRAALETVIEELRSRRDQP